MSTYILRHSCKSNCFCFLRQQISSLKHNLLNTISETVLCLTIPSSPSFNQVKDAKNDLELSSSSKQTTHTHIYIYIYPTTPWEQTFSQSLHRKRKDSKKCNTKGATLNSHEVWDCRRVSFIFDQTFSCKFH